MENASPNPGKAAREPWLRGVCVLIAFLLLYNPFLALYCSHASVSVHTPPRNRATIGASELQHFGLFQKEIRSTDLTVEGIRQEPATPARSYVGRGLKRDEEIPQAGFSAKIWSRPPPSL